MTETMQQYSQTETNRLIRAELKASYPGNRLHRPGLQRGRHHSDGHRLGDSLPADVGRV